MSNMSYCRFQNTVKDLLDCEENIYNILGAREHRARKQLVEACVRIAEAAGENGENLPSEDPGE